MTRPPHAWKTPPGETSPAAPVEWMLAGKQRRNGAAPKAEKLPPVIRDGEWHTTMVSAAGTLRRRGFSEQAALAALVAENAGKYQGTIPPDSDEELAELVADVYGRYDAVEEIPVQRAYNGPHRALDEVVDTFQRHLHMPDPAPVHVVLATAIANRIPEGDPVWVVIIAGSSRGKTELLLSLDGYPGVRVVGAVTVAALLSGTARKERAKNATGGVLLELGDQGLLVVKDFGAILSLHRDTRAQVLQALRDVYDGLYQRDVGADGGTKLEWRGRVGLLAGATSALDQAHAVLSALGERWLTLRLPPGEEAGMAKTTLRGVDTAAMRAELRDAVQGFLATVDVPQLRTLSADEEELLAALAVLVCFARSPVERERDYKREIVLVHQPEGPGRMARQLHKLYVALQAIGVDAAATLVKVGLDSIPSPRRDVLLHLLEHGQEQSASNIARALRLPTVSARRALEELAAHNLLEWRKSADAENAAHLWNASSSALELWQPLAAIAGAEGK